FKAAVSDYEAGDHEQRREREEGALGQPRGERPDDQKRAEEGGGRLEARHLRRRPDLYVRLCGGVSACRSCDRPGDRAGPKCHSSEVWGRSSGVYWTSSTKLSVEAVAKWRQKTGSARQATLCETAITSSVSSKTSSCRQTCS